jgi:hypothetical protein
MKLKLGTDNIFNCPEGRFRGVIERIGEPKKRINKPCDQQVRITVRVATPARREHLVMRTFCADLNYGSELYNFLDSWLEGRFEQFLAEDGQVDLNLMIGKEADVLVSHYEDGKHAQPFVQIAGIFPSGTLIEN